MESKNKILIIVLVLAIVVVGGGVGALFYFIPHNVAVVETPEATSEVTSEVQNLPYSNSVEPTSTTPTTSVAPTSTPTNLITKKNTMPIVKIATNKGDITVELFADDAPKAAENFVTLAKKGFYDGVIFHRVISGFMIQGGDPTGTGRGGPGYQFADELNPATASYKRGYVRGTLAMANSGPDTNGSQFFIMHADYPLPHAYTIFGRVTSGIEVVDAIAAGAVDGNDRPLSEVKMTKVTVEE